MSTFESDCDDEGTLLVVAKAPVPGRVKTRLTPHFTPQQAAALARAALQDTLDAVLATPPGGASSTSTGRRGSGCPTASRWSPSARAGSTPDWPRPSPCTAAPRS